MDEDELRSIPVRKFRGGIDGSHQYSFPFTYSDALFV